MAVGRWEQRVDVLGPVTVRGAGGIVALTRSMEIGVLSILALHAGSPVGGGSLIDVLWPDDPPRTASKTLQGYVKRVRSMVAVNGIELTYAGPAGYVLQLPPEQVDATTFEALVSHARTADDDRQRLSRFDEALALWRGEPFAGCDLEGLRPHREWLNRLRSGTLVERTAALVRSGVSADTISTIRALIVGDPTNERLWLHLAGALYLIGNPVAALEAIADARRELDDRVGVTLGPELTELQAHMLSHDDVEQCYHRLTGASPGSVTVAGERVRPTEMPPLPLSSGPIIGRDALVVDIADLVDGDSRIVTVTGAGGMGKTRCAVEAARRATTPCLGFVDLSALTTGKELALHLAGSFGVADRDDPVSAVAARLGDSRGSVVLDNVEQIADVAAVIGELARRCPSTVWLVTSQAELGISAERVVRLGPIEHETDGTTLSPAALLLATAAERRGVKLGHPHQIEGIAALIGGIPLALELAACQLQHLDPDALMRSLQRPLDALVDPRQALGRHRSMRACFELGLSGLGPDARDLFALVSRRANGCRYDDLLQWWSRSTPLPQAVAELVEAGFAATAPDTAGATRLVQLPLVRAFGRTVPRGIDADGAEQALDLHLLGRAQASMTATKSTVVEPDLADIRRLLQRGLDEPEALDTAVQLAVMLILFWWSVRITEGRQWFDALLVRLAGQPSPLTPYAVFASAFLDFYVGDAASAGRRLDDGLRTQAPDPTAQSRLLSLRSMLDSAAGEHELATQRSDQAIELARASGDDQTQFYALGNGGDVALSAGALEVARERYVECIERLRRGGTDWLAAAPHARLGDLELSAGALRLSRMWYDRSIALWSSRDLGPGAPQTLAGLARLDVAEGDLDGARRHLETALATAERCGSRGEYPWIVLGYAALLAADGEGDRAGVLFELGRRLGRQAGHNVDRLIEAELASAYAAAVVDRPAVLADPVVVTTPLEDVPQLLAKLGAR
ncbi:MAG TPA: BTAD domain-containing putative transcriptional regulator [Propionibacteriaceae bacterium]